MTAIAQIGVSRLNTALDWLVGVAQAEMSFMRDGLARRTLYRKTYCGLQSKSDVELAQAGLARSDIQATAIRIAMEADVI